MDAVHLSESETRINHQPQIVEECIQHANINKGQKTTSTEGIMLSSMFQSPKSLLASSIAQNLSMYFHVDPSEIESNLVSDTKLTLRNAKLKPFSPFDGCLLLGDVKHVEFSWKWGGASDGSTSFISETMLTISGADFQLCPVGNHQAASNALEVKPEVLGVNSWSYLTKHVDQILDHLTCNLKDIRLTICPALAAEDSRSASLVFEVSSLQLLSLGRQHSDLDAYSPPLSQRLTLGLFTAYVMQNGESFPLVDPISYSMSIKRVAGKRFRGLHEGLIIEGSEGTESVGLHLGKPQLSAVAVLTAAFERNESITASPEKAESSRSLDVSEAIEADAETNPPTSLQLTLPSLVVHLPKNSVVTFPQCGLDLLVDGSNCQISGVNGIEVNGMSVLCPQNGARWQIDVAKGEFVLDSPDAEVPDSVASVDMTQSTLQALANELSELMRSTPAMNAPSPSSADSPESLSSGFAVRLRGRTDFSLKNDAGSWIIASIGSLDVAVDLAGVTPSMTNFEVAGCRVGPTSLGHATMTIPEIKFDTERQVFFAKESVLAEVDTISVVSSLRDFTESFCAFFGASDYATRSNSFPFNVNMTSVHLKVCEPTAYSGLLENLSIHAMSSSIAVGSVDANGGDGFNLHAEGIAMSLQSLSVSIDKIGKMLVPGVYALDRPLHGFSVSILEKSVFVRFESAGVFLYEATGVKTTEHHEHSSDAREITFPDFCGISSIQIRVDETIAVSKRVSDSLVKLNCSQLCAGVNRHGGSVSFVIKDPLDFTAYKDHSLIQGKISPTSVTVALSDCLVEKVESEGIEIEHGSSIVTVGKVQLSEKSLRLSGPVVAKVGSISDIASLQNMIPAGTGGEGILSTWGNVVDLPFSCITSSSVDVDCQELRIGVTVENAVLNVKRLLSQEELMGSAGFAMRFVRIRLVDKVTVGLSRMATRFDIYKTGNCSVVTQEATELRIVDSTGQKYLMCTVNPSSVTLDAHAGLTQCLVSRLCITSTSFGLESLAVSNVVYNAIESTVQVKGDTSVALSTSDTFAEASQYLRSTQRMWESIQAEFGIVGSEELRHVSAGEVKISCRSPTFVLEFRDMKKAMSSITCEKAAITSNGVGQAVFSDLGASLAPETSTLTIGRIERCTIPDFGYLVIPTVEVTSMSYDERNGFVVALPATSIMMYNEVASSSPQNTVLGGNADEFVLPFSVSVFIQKVSLQSKSNALVNLDVESIQLDATPEPELYADGIRFGLSVHTLTHSMLRAQLLHASGCLSMSRKSLLNTKVNLGSVVMTVGLDWGSLLQEDTPNTQKQQRPWKLPNMFIEPITSSLCFEGNLLSTSANLKLPAFSGSSDCSIGDVLDHYKNTITQRLPLLLSNTKVAGQNMSEAGAQAIGSAILSSTPVGCVAGSVVGVAAVDGVRGALTAGKLARGASSDDSYRFGDFSGGVVQAVKLAAKDGASSRGADSYELGDVTAGTLRAGAAYAKENKAKLGSAGGSTLGMLVGAAALGPVGLVAGAVAGGLAASKALQKHNEDNSEARASIPLRSRVESGASAPETQQRNATPQFDQPPACLLPADYISAPLRQPNASSGTCAITSNIHFAQTRQSQPIGTQDGQSRGVVASNGGIQPLTNTFADINTNASTSTVRLPCTHTGAQQAGSPTNGSHIAGGQTVSGTRFDPYAPQSVSSPPAISSRVPYHNELSSKSAYHNHQALSGNGVPNSTSLRQPHQGATATAGLSGTLPPQQHSPATSPSGYQFGNITKSVVAKGKKGRTGDANAGYKFGDFTRGLFSK